MFWSDFDDFSGSGTIGALKVKNGDHMTQFSAQNIGTHFGVQFLLLAIGTEKNCFDRFLTTFPGPVPTGASKVENQARMTRF